MNNSNSSNFSNFSNISHISNSNHSPNNYVNTEFRNFNYNTAGTVTGSINDFKNNFANRSRDNFNTSGVHGNGSKSPARSANRNIQYRDLSSDFVKTDAFKSPISKSVQQVNKYYKF